MNATIDTPSRSRFALPERLTRFLRRFVFYPFFSFAVFCISFYWTFPYDRARDLVVHTVEREIPGAEIEIVSLEPWWLTGIAAEGVQLRLPAATPTERPTQLTIESLHVHAGLIALLTGQQNIAFDIALDGGGVMAGTYVGQPDRAHLVAHLESIDLRRIGPIRRYLGLPVEGHVGGDIDVLLADDAEATTGSIVLTIADLAVGDGHAEVPVPGLGRGLVIGRAAAGTLNVRIQIERSVGRIQTFASDGEDIALGGEGTIRFLRPVHMSGVNVLLRVLIKPPYLQRNAAINGALELAAMNPAVRAFRAADGAFQFRLQGTMGTRVSAEPAGSVAFTH